MLSFNSAVARFFVIKSYTHEDVHRSIRHSIWASTETGNRRLDRAFREAHPSCPVYLFYSVNASGHFCGVAMLKSGVDYSSTNSDIWSQRSRWKGKFVVQWILVKDVPNAVFKTIRCQNNEGKPVTNSRDTQELDYDAGITMLRIYKEFPMQSSALDNMNVARCIGQSA